MWGSCSRRLSRRSILFAPTKATGRSSCSPRTAAVNANKDVEIPPSVEFGEVDPSPDAVDDVFRSPSGDDDGS